MRTTISALEAMDRRLANTSDKAKTLGKEILILRQFLSCAVCGGLVRNPISLRNRGCEHNICKICVKGAKILQPPCHVCSDSRTMNRYVENRDKARLLAVFTNFCENLASNRFFDYMSNVALPQLDNMEPKIIINMSIQEIICEASGLNEVFTPTFPSNTSPSSFSTDEMRRLMTSSGDNARTSSAVARRERNNRTDDEVDDIFVEFTLGILNENANDESNGSSSSISTLNSASSSSSLNEEEFQAVREFLSGAHAESSDDSSDENPENEENEPINEPIGIPNDVPNEASHNEPNANEEAEQQPSVSQPLRERYPRTYARNNTNDGPRTKKPRLYFSDSSDDDYSAGSDSDENVDH